jgi:hypothetical protein
MAQQVPREPLCGPAVEVVLVACSPHLRQSRVCWGLVVATFPAAVASLPPLCWKKCQRNARTGAPGGLPSNSGSWLSSRSASSEGKAYKL